MDFSYLKLENLYQFIVLIIKYADEKDIKTFFKNCSIDKGAENKKPDEIISPTYYKEALIYDLFNLGIILHGYKTNNLSNENIIQNLQEEDNYKILLSHLFTLNGCIYTYDRNMIVKNFAKVFHVLVESYAKYKFYYEICGSNLIVTTNNGRLYYNITLQDNKTVLTDEDTGRKIILNILIACYIRNLNDNKIYNLEQTVSDFKKINRLIYEKLSEKTCSNFCAWCKPSNIKNAKRKCNNCKNLAEELKELQQITEVTEIKNINFNQKLQEIKANDIKELKEKRKKYLKEIVKQANICNPEYKSFLRRLKEAINKSFR